MTSSVPSLKDLVAGAIVSNNDIAQLQPMLSDDLINYLRSINGEIQLNLASELHASYLEITQSFTAMAGERAEADVAEQFLIAFNHLVALHNQASQALESAIATANSVGDDQWRAYLVPQLTEAQDQVAELGYRIGLYIDNLTLFMAGNQG
ncbi:MAG: hypothetical protein ACJ72N_20800 [Labedaea sp.]